MKILLILLMAACFANSCKHIMNLARIYAKGLVNAQYEYKQDESKLTFRTHLCLLWIQVVLSIATYAVSMFAFVKLVVQPET